MLKEQIRWAVDYIHGIDSVFHRTSQTLKKEELNLAVCGDLYNSLAVYLSDIREHWTGLRILPKTCYQMLTTED